MYIFNQFIVKNTVHFQHKFLVKPKKGKCDFHFVIWKSDADWTLIIEQLVKHQLHFHKLKAKTKRSVNYQKLCRSMYSFGINTIHKYVVLNDFAPGVGLSIKSNFNR